MAQFYVDTTFTFFKSSHGKFEGCTLGINSFLYEASTSVELCDFVIDPLEMGLQFVLGVLDFFDAGTQVVVNGVKLTPHAVGTHS